MPRVDLNFLDKAVDTVILPHIGGREGREIQAFYADAAAFDLWLEWQTNPGSVSLMKRICRRILRAATEQELDALTWPMMNAVIQLGVGQAEEVYKLLGESSAPGMIPDSRRSSPATPSAESASA